MGETKIYRGREKDIRH